MKVKVLSHIRHDGKSYEIGDAIDMPDEIAKRLVAGGSAEESQESGDTRSPEHQSTSRQAEVRESESQRVKESEGQRVKESEGQRVRGKG